MKKNKRNIIYGIIGVATLMLSIIGATFAYFTATAGNNNTIKGNMATIQFDVTATKMTTVDETLGGLIPMSNNMVEQALTKNSAVSGKGICVDDNGNAVCQVYKIIVNNNSSSSMFVDGYVTLANGSGAPTDVAQLVKSSTETTDPGRDYKVKSDNTTTMRWAQAFCSTETSGKVTSCTTAGNSTVRSSVAIPLLSPLSTSTETVTTLGGTKTKDNGYNINEIGIARSDVTLAANATDAAVIEGNKYEIINKNYIRISDHTYSNTAYTKVEDTNTAVDGIETSDITSALVFNQYLEADDGNTSNDNGTSSSTYKDAQVFYIVVWLSENGQNQTAGATGAATTANNFFQGTATFITAQGTEVSATFNGLTKVSPNT